MLRPFVTEDQCPIDIGMEDLINSIFLNPLDATVRALAREDEQLQRQIKPPSAQDMAEVEALALRAATLQDEVHELLSRFVASRSKELAGLKDQLLERMLGHGLSAVEIPGRPAIEVVVRNERKASKKSIQAAFQKILGDSKKAAQEANQLWNSIPQVQKESLVIPEPTPPEIDSPY